MMDSSAESTIMMDLMENVANESMSDFVLVSLDGDRIPANRFILGARSPVFRRQLFAGVPGKAQSTHGGQNFLEVGYSGSAIQGLVEFCRTDGISNFASRLDDEHKVRDLVQLFDCAVYYEINGLRQQALSTATQIFKQYRHLAAAVFDQACQEMTSASARAPIKNIALAAIQEDPVAALLNSNALGFAFGVPTISPGASFIGVEALTQILQDKKMNCEEILLFRVLTAWLACQPNQTKWADFDGATTPMDVARELVKHIELVKIAPSELLTTVASSGLVSKEKVTNAMAEIAQLIEKEGTFAMNRPRPALVSAFARKSHVFPSKTTNNPYSTEHTQRFQIPAKRTLPVNRNEAPKQSVRDLLHQDALLAQAAADISFEENEVPARGHKQALEEELDTIVASSTDSAASEEKNSPHRRRRPPSPKEKRRKQASPKANKTTPERRGALGKGVLFLADKADTLCGCHDGSYESTLP